MTIAQGRDETLLDRLQAADQRIREVAGKRRTLDPAREEATPLAKLAARLLDGERDLALRRAFVDGLCALVEAEVRSFPGNLFWDFDLLSAHVLSAGRRAGSPAATVGAAFALMTELQVLFGGATSIKFRYTHDFVYGFDWAKWVRRDPATRAGIGPFDLPFLRGMVRRGHELLALIAGDDPTYPSLRDASHRNPFGFSREPEHELAVFEKLARDGLIPVETWRIDAAPTWDRPYADLRAEVARDLGLGAP